MNEVGTYYFHIAKTLKINDLQFIDFINSQYFSGKNVQVEVALMEVLVPLALEYAVNVSRYLG